MRLKASRSVRCDAEVAGEGWSNVGGSSVGIDLWKFVSWDDLLYITISYLVIDETPLL